jgi:hypothetical protein
VAVATTDENSYYQTVALRWDGNRWTREATPSASYASNGSSLSAVSCSSTVICTAVGFGDGSNLGLAEQRAATTSNHFTVSGVHTFADGTSKFRITVPGPGTIEVLETAPNDNLAHAATLLYPVPERIVFARKNLRASQTGTANVNITPTISGKQLLSHHRDRIVLRLWIAYTPTNGRPREIGVPGLHLPSS